MYRQMNKKEDRINIGKACNYKKSRKDISLYSCCRVMTR